MTISGQPSLTQSPRLVPFCNTRELATLTRGRQLSRAVPLFLHRHRRVASCVTPGPPLVDIVPPSSVPQCDADVVAGRPSELAYRIPARPNHRAAPRAPQRVPAPAGSRSKTLWMRTRSMNVFRIRPLLGGAAAILLLAGFAAGPVQAQRGSVTGQVTDKSNQQAVTGASVLVVGTNLQGRTNRDGRYTITNVPAGQYQVQVRLIGYATATNPVSVTAGQIATADFALTPAAVPLDVVIVSATGQEQLKRESGSNVGTIDASKVAQEAAPVNAADLLNSRVPGVEVMQSGGTTGTGSRIRIRGATSLSLRNEPIIVVDGVRVDNVPNADGGLGAAGGQAPSRLNDLNPEDWESVEVVKGPSAAALYGTDAANGVIQIRTKQGKPGPTKWTAFTEAG